MLTTAGEPIDTDMQVYLQQDTTGDYGYSIVLNTTDQQYAGEHKLMIRAYSYTYVTMWNEVPYDFSLFLEGLPTLEQDPNTAPALASVVKSVKIAEAGIFSLVLPEVTDEDGDNVAVEVLLTGASDWLEYDQNTNSIRKKDQSVDIPAGEYNFIVRLKDDSRLGEKES